MGTFEQNGNDDVDDDDDDDDNDDDDDETFLVLEASNNIPQFGSTCILITNPSSISAGLLPIHELYRWSAPHSCEKRGDGFLDSCGHRQ